MSSINGTILLVDDDKANLVLVERAIRKLHYQNKIVFMNNGAEALEYLRDRENPVPFIIISDINMPKMNGLELLRELQEDEFLSQKAIPFVFLSSSSTQAEVKEAYRQNAQGYFEKPVEFRDLVTLIEKVLEYWAKCIHPKLY